MKLRIRGNSVRLRLSQGDVAALIDAGAVEERVSFGQGAALAYRLESTTEAYAHATLTGNRLLVRFPAAEIAAWARPESVSMRAEQPLDGAERLSLLVEKDFQCLSPRAGEDDADTFPNPAQDAS